MQKGFIMAFKELKLWNPIYVSLENYLLEKMSLEFNFP